eukprot:CAMPEP_0201478480 /NCGR_PEP_ID=MMETSP0151_2-20130828/3301_1 /ASSEMBLY_ACC=CAM_ASM_000257 /TAXON_ID=200890 /ORGANISM="Paramoeba atlantica, Strain 621/1 / CCAP 1560/9" /LENGTH=911 /DNA_ID=CAMNT_0047859563 /DNA_START=152 /DNA_END=2887 /DNA_ORIENTATION=-
MSVFGWGSNKSKQLGDGEERKPQPTPQLLTCFLGTTIRQISCGDQHNLAVGELGEVYVWGRGREGQLANGENVPFIDKPQRVWALRDHNVVQVASGHYHCLALTKEGKVFQWGRLHKYKTKGEVEMGHQQQYSLSGGISLPQEQEKMRAEMLDKSHLEYYCGEVDSEEIKESMELINFGTFQTFLQKVPVQVNFSVSKAGPIGSIHAGYAFSFAIDVDGHPYSWGYNDRFQLGLGHRYNAQDPQRVRVIYQGDDDDEEEREEKGKEEEKEEDKGKEEDRGEEKGEEKVRWKKKKLKRGEECTIVSVACGQQHTLLLTDDGSIYSCGLGVFGQLGHGTTDDFRRAKMIQYLKNESVSQICSGSFHSMALTRQGTLWIWGNGEYGQQGGLSDHMDWGGEESGKKQLAYSLPHRIRIGNEDGDTARVVQVTAGHLHNHAVSDRREVYSWGWNESGSLGIGTLRYALVPQSVSALEGDQITCISGGGRHTFAVCVSGVSSLPYDLGAGKPLLPYCDITFVIARSRKHMMNYYASAFTSSSSSSPSPFSSSTPSPSSSSSLSSSSSPSSSAASALSAFFEKKIAAAKLSELSEESQISQPSQQFHSLQEDFVFPAHRAVVGARSSYLKALILLNDRYCVSDGTIRLPSSTFKPMAFKQVLYYIYTDTIRCSKHVAKEVLKLAQKLNLPHLEYLCSNLVSSSSSSHSVESTMIRDLEEAMYDGTFSDISICLPSLPSSASSSLSLSLSPEPIRAHRVFLSARSEYFKVIFESKFREKQAASLSLYDVNVDVFPDLLKYLYTGAPLSEEEELDTVISLLAESDRFLIPDLKQICEIQLEQSLNTENVVAVYVIADRFSSGRLKKVCLDFIHLSGMEIGPKEEEGIFEFTRDATVQTRLFKEINHYLDVRNRKKMARGR